MIGEDGRAAILHRLRPLNDSIGWRADLRERVSRWALDGESEAAFPAARLTDLGKIGLLGRFVTVTPGEQTTDLLDTLRLVGGANLGLGRIFEGHVNAVQLVHAYGTPVQRARLAGDLATGRTFGVWNTESAPGLTLARVPGGWRLNGAKMFATGTGYLDRALVTARLAEGGKQMVVVDLTGRGDRADASGWAVRGMRGTVSGRFDFTGIIVDENALLGATDDYEREPRFSAGAWRFTAVQLGAIEALVRYLRSHLLTSDKGEDVIQRTRFAGCAAAARTAGMWVVRAAQSAEAGGADAIPMVMLTRGIVEDAGLAVMEATTRAVGTAAFFTANPIDRITRDLGLYLRQPAPDAARVRAGAAWLAADPWADDPWW